MSAYSDRSETRTTAGVNEDGSENDVLTTEVETTVHELMIEGPDSLLQPREAKIQRNKKRMVRLGIGILIALLALALGTGIVMSKRIFPTSSKFLKDEDFAVVDRDISAFTSDLFVTSIPANDNLVLSLRELQGIYHSNLRDGKLPKSTNAMLQYASYIMPARKTFSQLMSKVAQKKTDPESMLEIEELSKSLKRQTSRQVYAWKQLRKNFVKMSKDTDMSEQERERMSENAKAAKAITPYVKLNEEIMLNEVRDFILSKNPSQRLYSERSTRRSPELTAEALKAFGFLRFEPFENLIFNAHSHILK